MNNTDYTDYLQSFGEPPPYTSPQESQYQGYPVAQHLHYYERGVPEQYPQEYPPPYQYSRQVTVQQQFFAAIWTLTELCKSMTTNTAYATGKNAIGEVKLLNKSFMSPQDQKKFTQIIMKGENALIKKPTIRENQFSFSAKKVAAVGVALFCLRVVGREAFGFGLLTTAGLTCVFVLKTIFTNMNKKNEVVKEYTVNPEFNGFIVDLTNFYNTKVNEYILQPAYS